MNLCGKAGGKHNAPRNKIGGETQIFSMMIIINIT